MFIRFGALVRADALNVVLFGVLLSAAPSLAFGALRASGAIPPLGDDMRSLIWGQPAELFANTLVGLFVQGALIADALKRERRSPAAAAADGVRLILPLFAIQLGANLLIGIGLIFLIVPGLYLLTRYVVAAPARVDRRNLDLGDAFGRSADLTEDNRWMILLLTIVGVALVTAPAFLLGLLLGAFIPDPAGQVVWTELLVTPLSQSGTVLLTSLGLAALYIELKRLRGEDESVAEVFT